VYTGEELLAAEVPAWLVRLLSFVFGALWGSFFNVAIYRWPRDMPVVTPPSHCPACGAPVRWYLNVPVFGYLLLGGKARCCGAPMTPRYVWVELISAVLCVAVAERFMVRAAEGVSYQQGLLDTALYFTFVGGLIIATFVDLEWMEIPDEVSLPGAALGLATVGLRTGPAPIDAAVGAGIGFMVVYVLFVCAYELLRGHRGMGFGDAKLLLMIGAFLGWESVLFCLAAGSAQGLVAAGLAYAFGVPMVPKRPDDSVEAPPGVEPGAQGATAAPDDVTQPEAVAEQGPAPPKIVFGPMLALSALEFLFFGERILAWLANS
jgi:leader peptidase (prepilin peptidase)/N-methyltransferase